MAMKQIQVVQQPTRETSVSWSSLFPHDTKTITGSEIFIKQLTALMFSCITHIRGIFPEYAFYDKILDDRKLKLLKGHYDCKNAYLMTRWLKSAFKALDLQYMQTLILELLTLDDQPLEYYAIDFTYANNEPSCTFHANNEKEKAISFSNSSVENATKKMVYAMLDATEGLGDLPTSFQLQLRIQYYDDRTPVSYSPEYFVNAAPYDWDRVHNLKRIKLGSVCTNYHSITLSSGSTLVPSDGSDLPLFYFQNEDNCSREVQQKDNCGWHYWENEQKIINVSSSDHSKENDDNKQSEELNVVDSETEYIPPSPTAQVSPQNKIKLLDQTTMHKCGSFIESSECVECMSTATISTNSQATIAITDANSSTNNVEDNMIKMNCMCGIISYKDDIFKCSNCNFWHHWVCYKFWPDSKDLELKYCYSCSKSNNFACLDEHLLNCSLRQIKNVMLYRQMLHKFQYIKNLTCESIGKAFNLSEYQAKKFMKRFKNDGLIKQSGCQDSFHVQSQKLNKFLMHYFHY